MIALVKTLNTKYSMPSRDPTAACLENAAVVKPVMNKLHLALYFVVNCLMPQPSLFAAACLRYTVGNV